MKLSTLITPLALAGLIFTAPYAYSRDSKHMLSIEEAMQSTNFKEKLDPSIKLYFGDQKHGAITKNILRDIVTNHKTNAFGKTDEVACRWVFLTDLLALQERAKNEGGNAVVNIKSYYKRNEFSSRTQYECHAGSIIAGVALKGDIVKLK